MEDRTTAISDIFRPDPLLHLRNVSVKDVLVSGGASSSNNPTNVVVTRQGPSPLPETFSASTGRSIPASRAPPPSGSGGVDGDSSGGVPAIAVAETAEGSSPPDFGHHRRANTGSSAEVDGENDVVGCEKRKEIGQEGGGAAIAGQNVKALPPPALPSTLTAVATDLIIPDQPTTPPISSSKQQLLTEEVGAGRGVPEGAGSSGSHPGLRLRSESYREKGQQSPRPDFLSDQNGKGHSGIFSADFGEGRGWVAGEGGVSPPPFAAAFFAVYDGHDGDVVAETLHQKLHKIIAKQVRCGQISANPLIWFLFRVARVVTMFPT